MIQSLEGWPTKAKEATSPHEVRLTLLDTNPVFQYPGGGITLCTDNKFSKKNFLISFSTVFLCCSLIGNIY